MNKVSGYGHNGAPIYESRSDLPDDIPQLEWFKCNAKQFLDDLLRLPLDERGFYASAIMVMYSEMETLPADDRMAAHRLAMDVRSYRAFLRKLMERKSITSEVPLLYKRPSGRISNYRYDEEITAYVEAIKKRRDAASEREAKRKTAKSDTKMQEQQEPVAETINGQIVPDVRGMSEGCPPIPGTSSGHSTSIVPSIEYGSSQKTQQNQCVDHQSTSRAVAELWQSCGTERERERERKNPPYAPQGGSDAFSLDGPPQTQGPDQIDLAFDQFWAAFPPGRKQGKGEAAVLFRKIVTGRHRDKRMRAKAADLVAAAERYARTRPDPKFTPMPSTWLNSGRWLDEPAKAGMTSNGHDTKSLSEALDRARALENEDRRW